MECSRDNVVIHNSYVVPDNVRFVTPYRSRSVQDSEGDKSDSQSKALGDHGANHCDIFIDVPDIDNRPDVVQYIEERFVDETGFKPYLQRWNKYVYIDTHLYDITDEYNIYRIRTDVQSTVRSEQVDNIGYALLR
jgi:hypothetical protein